MQIADYWSKPPDDQGDIRTQIEQEEAKAETERKRIVGYFTTIDGGDSTMYPREPDRDIIVCAECYGDLLYHDDWEPITKEEYLDKDDVAFKAKCSECKKPLA
jgi:hypothetical protein